MITSLENKKEDKRKEKERIIAEIIKKEKLAKINVEKYLEEQEKNRLDFQKETNIKCN